MLQARAIDTKVDNEIKRIDREQKERTDKGEPEDLIEETRKEVLNWVKRNR